MNRSSAHLLDHELATVQQSWRDRQHQQTTASDQPAPEDHKSSESKPNSTPKQRFKPPRQLAARGSSLGGRSLNSPLERVYATHRRNSVDCAGLKKAPGTVRGDPESTRHVFDGSSLSDMSDEQLKAFIRKVMTAELGFAKEAFQVGALEPRPGHSQIAVTFRLLLEKARDAVRRFKSRMGLVVSMRGECAAQPGT